MTARRLSEKSFVSDLEALTGVVAAVFETPLGWIGMAWAQAGLQRLTLGHANPRKARDALAAFGVCCGEMSVPCSDLPKRITAFLEGDEDDFCDVKLDLDSLTLFQRSVLEHCRRIRPGTTLTYGELARKAGSPRAARAVGTVMANNRFPLVVPCHRVVAADGLGGYSAHNGLALKRWLLCREGAQVTN
jgi:methylated-DNA-[protein]-cysteine S-methyltransferase